MSLSRVLHENQTLMEMTRDLESGQLDSVLDHLEHLIQALYDDSSKRRAFIARLFEYKSRKENKLTKS